jgi:hypothetical protein
LGERRPVHVRQSLDGLEAVEAGHFKVEQYKVGPPCRDGIEESAPAGKAADELDVRILLNQRTELAESRRIMVADRNAQHATAIIA